MHPLYPNNTVYYSWTVSYCLLVDTGVVLYQYSGTNQMMLNGIEVETRQKEPKLAIHNNVLHDRVPKPIITIEHEHKLIDRIKENAHKTVYSIEISFW